MQVEVCANSLESALNAQKAGADRIEICSELGLGGVTPSFGLLKAVKEHIHIPVHVLIRPRGGDFVYSDFDFKVMLNDIDHCISLGFEGIVSGVLMSDFIIDLKRTEQLIAASRGSKFTFHRAFDWVQDPFIALQQLEQLGVNYVLTSGQQKKAEDGIELLSALNENTKHCQIIPASGINYDNVLLFKEKKFKNVHFSAASLLEKNVNRKNLPMSFLPFLDEDKVAISNLQTIQDIVTRVK